MWFESVKKHRKKILLFQKCAVNFWLKKWLENARKFIQPHSKIFRSFFLQKKLAKHSLKLNFLFFFLQISKFFGKMNISRGSSSISSNKFTSNFVEGDSNSIGDSVLMVKSQMSKNIEICWYICKFFVGLLLVLRWRDFCS